MIYLIIFLSFFISVSCDAIAEQFDSSAFLQRKESLIRMGDAKYVVTKIAKMHAYDVLAATAKKGCANKDWADYMVDLPSMDAPYPPDGPIDIFALPPLVRYLYQFGHCLTDNQKDKIISTFTSKKQQLYGHGTLNHAILRATSWYLLAQYFPNAKWLHFDGKYYTSQQIMADLKVLMIKRNKSLMAAGHYEWLSPTYAMVNFFPLLNLIDFSKDAELVKLAQQEATLELAALKASSFHGVIVPPLTRKNVDQVNALDDPQNYTSGTSQHILWYYFGEPNGLGLYDFQSRKEPFYAIMMALSDWSPSKQILELPDNKGIVKINTTSSGIWDSVTHTVLYGDSYISDNFAIGTGNQIINPEGYENHIQTFSILLKTTKSQNQIECYQPYWRSNQGEDLWGIDRSSPFQQMYRYNSSSVVMLFNIPDKDPWVYDYNNHYYKERNQHSSKLLQLVTCRIPKNLDQIVKEDNWLFLREGKTYVAIATLKGFNFYNDAPSSLTSKFLVLKIREPKTALFFRVETETKSQNFEQFMKKVRNQKPNYDVNYDSVSIEELSGVKTTVKFNLKKINQNEWSSIPIVIKNGIVTNPDDSYVIQSRSVNLKNSILTIH